jgi:hypothetical protein
MKARKGSKRLTYSSPTTTPGAALMRKNWGVPGSLQPVVTVPYSVARNLAFFGESSESREKYTWDQLLTDGIWVSVPTA